MKINSNNYKNFTYFILLLIGVSTFFAYSISSLLDFYGINVPFYIEIPSIPLIYSILFYVFDKHIWRWKIFKKAGIIIADDLSGEWIGIAKSSHDNFLSETKTVFKIKQSATDIIINGEFEKSKSVSLNANFAESEVDNNIALFYFYRNEPSYDAVETMAMHEGSVKLIYNAKENSLEGSYYAGRDRNEYGTIKLSRKQKMC
jgi:hypothetical protein